MRLYVEVARRTYARTSTYRRATVAGVFTNTVFGFLLAYVLRPSTSSGPLGGPFDVTDAVTFTFVAQGLLMPLGLFSTTEIADRIKTGDVIVDLQRPFDYQGWWAAVEYGKAGFYLLFRGIPPFLAGALVFDLRLPSAPTFAGLPRRGRASPSAISLRVALPAAAHGLLAARRPRPQPARAPHRALPLRRLRADRVLPGVARDARAACLPFAWMLQVPIEVWLGEHQGIDLLLVYAAQAAWLARRSSRSGGWCSPAPCAGWWCRVAEAVAASSGSGAAWSAPRSAPAGSTARRSCCSCSARRSSCASTSRVILVDLHEGRHAGRLVGDRGRAALRAQRRGVRDGRHVGERGRERHRAHQGGHLRPVPPPAGVAAAAPHRLRVRAPPDRAGAPAGRRAGRRARAARHRLDGRPTCCSCRVTLVAGTVIFGAVWIATSAAAFWTVEGQEMGNAFTYGGNLATQYPIDVLGDWLRRLFTFVSRSPSSPTCPASEMSASRRRSACPTGRCGRRRSSPSSPRLRRAGDLAHRRPPPPEHRELT